MTSLTLMLKVLNKLNSSQLALSLNYFSLEETMLEKFSRMHFFVGLEIRPITSELSEISMSRLLIYNRPRYGAKVAS